MLAAVAATSKILEKKGQGTQKPGQTVQQAYHPQSVPSTYHHTYHPQKIYNMQQKQSYHHSSSHKEWHQRKTDYYHSRPTQTKTVQKVDAVATTAVTKPTGQKKEGRPVPKATTVTVSDKRPGTAMKNMGTSHSKQEGKSKDKAAKKVIAKNEEKSTKSIGSIASALGSLNNGFMAPALTAKATSAKPEKKVR